MTTTKAVIEEALIWIGSPYKSSGAQECGANCLGVFGGILRNIGSLEGLVAEIEHHAKYAKPIRSGEFLRLLIASDYLETIRPLEYKVGDFLLMRVRDEPQHMALITEPGIVLHASSLHGRVIRHGLPKNWRPSCEFRIVGLQ